MRLGDFIKKITNFFGFKTCEACERRRVYLNNLFTYKNKEIIMSEEQIEIIEELLESEPLKVNCKVLNDIRRQIDGVWYEGCFCTATERRVFYSNYKEWYKEIRKNND